MLSMASSATPVFDRSFLLDAQLEFVVLGDTHFILDPEVYASGNDSQDPRLTRMWPARAEWALRLAAALETSFVVHLGDLAQDYPGKPSFVKARQAARQQLRRCGLQPYHVPGNMDIGDKPDPTMPAEWVTPSSLAEWHDQFGRSWCSFDRQGIHCVFLNSQIMNGPLPEAEEQRRWLESDLDEHTGQRVFTFLHMPPFFAGEHEPGLGYYDNLDEPARGWLLGLLRKHKVELLFSGHMHFAAFNRVDNTRLLSVPSTTTTRPGFYEAFSILPPDQGKNDLAKLGFYLVRVHKDGACAHLVRTGGETEPAPAEGLTRRLVTRISRDLPNSPIGVYLRLPLTQAVDGVIAWPDSVRDQVRNDYPFLACMELGARHLRAPASDLENGLQRQRLAMARDEGLQVSFVWLWSDKLRLTEVVSRYRDQIDAIEVQIPGTLWPEENCLRQIMRCRDQLDIPVTLAPLLALERSPGKYHPRARVGYRATELAELNQHLLQHDTHIDRVLCHVDSHVRPWEAMQEFIRRDALSQVGHFDFVVQLPGLDENAQANRAAEAVLAAALHSGCRLFLDPLVDLDRTGDINHGLLDRLSNPRPAFHIVRCMNTVLFASEKEFRPMANKSPETQMLGVEGHMRRLWLLLPDAGETINSTALDGVTGTGRETLCFDLVAGTSAAFRENQEELRQRLSSLRSPTLLMQETNP